MDPQAAVFALIADAQALDAATADYVAPAERGGSDNADRLHDAYADVMATRGDLIAWVARGGFRPTGYVRALDAAGNALNAADDAHRAATGEWVAIEV